MGTRQVNITFLTEWLLAKLVSVLGTSLRNDTIKPIIEPGQPVATNLLVEGDGLRVEIDLETQQSPHPGSLTCDVEDPPGNHMLLGLHLRQGKTTPTKHVLLD